MKRLFAELRRTSRMLHYDFCPSANSRVYWLKHPLVVLTVIALVALAVGVLVNPYAYILFAVAAVVIGSGIVWPLIVVRGLGAEVEMLSAHCRVGEMAVIRLRLQNRWLFPVFGLSLQRGFLTTGVAHDGVALASLPPCGTVECEWLFYPARRGVYPSEPPVLETAFPFGIFTRGTPARLRGQLIVWPETVPLTSVPDACEIDSREERVPGRRVGEAGDMIGTRDFRDGDSLRRVHWAQTARMGRLIVSERQAFTSCALSVVLDVRAESYRGLHAESFETAISIAASLVESLHRQHAHVELTAGDQHVLIGESAHELRNGLDCLARLPAGGVVGVRGGELSSPRLRRATFAVTSRQAYDRHLAQGHHASEQQFIVICSEEHRHEVSTCGCLPRFEVTCERPLADQLPALWTRACHA